MPAEFVSYNPDYDALFVALATPITTSEVAELKRSISLLGVLVDDLHLETGRYGLWVKLPKGAAAAEVARRVNEITRPRLSITVAELVLRAQPFTCMRHGNFTIQLRFLQGFAAPDIDTFTKALKHKLLQRCHSWPTSDQEWQGVLVTAKSILEDLGAHLILMSCSP